MAIIEKLIEKGSDLWYDLSFIYKSTIKTKEDLIEVLENQDQKLAAIAIFGSLRGFIDEIYEANEIGYPIGTDEEIEQEKNGLEEKYNEIVMKFSWEG